MIQFDEVTRNYGIKVAVQGLSLTVPPGELFALLGPNGAGKTTTLKMLVGLLRPSAGKIRVCDCDLVSQTREAVRHIGYVPDEPYLYDKLTGREFLQFVAEMRGMEPVRTAEGIERETDHFGLASFIDDLAETYSLGMKQRLVFASALLHQPELLVIDEPMVGLDPRSGRVVKNLLRQRAREGTTVFMSTHLLSVAEEIADRIGIFVEGQLGFLGTVEELRRQLALEHSSLEELFLRLTDSDSEADTASGCVGEEPCSP